MSMPQDPTRSSWDEDLYQRRQSVSVFLLILGAALFAAVLFLFLRYKWDYAPIWSGCFLFGLTALGAGIWLRQAQVGGLTGRDSARLLVLLLGGALGLSMSIGGIWQTIYWWKFITGGWEAWQGEERWHLWVLSGNYLAGLLIMFFSLLLARVEQAENPALRRLLYGYNAVLTGLLLLVILVIVNILSTRLLPPSSDWTEAGIFTLSSQSENVLKGIDQPVKVYVIIEDRGTRFSAEMRDLLDNARSYTDKLSVEYLVRDLNVEEVDRLSRQYNLPDAIGALVVYGTGDQEKYSFIKREDVYQQPNRMDPENPQRGATFKGEDALVSALLFLEEGKKKPVVYFLQGEGELDLFGALEGAKPDRTARALRDRLDKANYEVKGLRLGKELGKSDDPRIVISDKVPDDAAVVVIAGPRQEFSAEALKALRTYMTVPRKVKEKDPADPSKEKERDIKGKMYVLMGVVPGPGDKMVSTGLEGLLSELDVDVGNERILLPIKGGRRPDQVYVMTNPELRDRNPLAANITEIVPMTDLRPVQPRSAAPQPGQPPRYQADRLMITAPPIIQRTPVWAEADLRSPEAIIADVEKHPERIADKLRSTITVAVAVSDPGASNPMDPHAGLPGMQKGDGTPRAIVIGDSRFASDAAIAGGGREEGGSLYYELFANSLAWLRERPSSIGISPKDRKIYRMKEGTNISAMVNTPFVLMALSIIGVGLGVWVVRRR
jgi:hypothetical protein